MNRSRLILRLALLLTSVTAAACSSATVGQQPLPPLLGAAPVTEPPELNMADVHFMTGMIPHHAQAVRMALLVPDRSSREDVRLMAERMLVGQRDEIELMRMWLADNGQPVPAADATHMRMNHGGMMHDMLMPGMLTEEELTRLEQARGVEFDRMFLAFMVRHHEGAMIMVDELFAAPGAAQDDFVYKFASDVNADQNMEVRRMQEILSSLPPGRSP